MTRSKFYLNCCASAQFADTVYWTYRIVIDEFIYNMDKQMEKFDRISMRKLRWYEPETEIVWIQVVIIMGLHAGGLYYFITFPYMEQKFLIIYSMILIYLMNMGITAGVHRLWTHRSYKAKLPLRILLASFYYAAGHTSIYTWVRDHRVHHKYTDTEADPHNSNRGFWFSHIGWLMLKKNKEVIECRKEIDMSDIKQDAVVKFFDRNSLIMRISLNIIIPTLIPVYFFNQDLKWSFISQVFLRYPYVLNAAFIVNSFGHTIGHRTYNKSIRPTENTLIAFITSGEGWHNYHHVFPWDYRAAAFKSIFLNSTTSVIDLFAKIGWAYDLKYATAEHIKNVVRKKGDGSHYKISEMND